MSLPHPDRRLAFAVAALVVVFAVFEFTYLDLAVQDHLYRFDEGRWLVDRADPVLRLIFYTGPKYIIGLLALTLLWRAWKSPSREDRKNLAVALLSIVATPTLVGLGKDTTNVFCPWDITRYGGDVAYMRVLESYPEDQRPPGRGRGFPAGHASGGFALMSLSGLATTRRGRWVGLAIGLATGTLMGLYQMAKGAHYLSHTLITALVAWIVFLLLQKLLRVARHSGAERRESLPTLMQVVSSQAPQTATINDVHQKEDHIP